MMNAAYYLVFLFLFLTVITCSGQRKDSVAEDDTYNVLRRDGSYEFGYANRDRGASYHYSSANARNVVRGKFGARNPATRRIDETVYTAGPRGFRPRGPNVHRKYDLNQNGPRPIGSRDDPYFDPFEDPSFSYSFRTRDFNKQESANRHGDVTGRYSYLDDVGERHNVEYIAGKNTGFHVKSAYPDSNPRAFGPLFHTGPGKRPRGHTSIQRGLDGSYRFVSAGPDQRRTETSDSAGNVRGSYTYLDDRGKQHVVHYIAGPNIGYRVLKNPKEYPTLYPFAHGPPITVTGVSTGLEDSIFDGPDENLNTAASGHGTKPRPRPHLRPRPTSTTQRPLGFDESESDDTDSNDLFGDQGGGGAGGGGGGKDDIGDIFNNSKDDFGDSDNVFGDKRPGGYPPHRPGASGGSSSSSGSGTNPPQLVPSNIPGDPHLIPSNIPGDRPGSHYGDESSEENVPDLFGGNEAGGGGSSTARPDCCRDSSAGSGQSYDSHSSGGDDDSDLGTTLNIYPENDPALKPSHGLGGTILRNLGSKDVNLPPGVAVRAHVQSIDILPYGARLPSPSDQLEHDNKQRT